MRKAPSDRHCNEQWNVEGFLTNPENTCWIILGDRAQHVTFDENTKKLRRGMISPSIPEGTRIYGVSFYEGNFLRIHDLIIG